MGVMANPRMSFRAYVTAWLIFSLLPAMIFLATQSNPFQRLAFRTLVSDEEYLIGIRESNLGCTTLSIRGAEVLVIGDSHAYAGWDFVLLESYLNEKIGGCALGGLYVETLPVFIDKLVSNSLTPPKHIILSVSPRMFWESQTKSEQIGAHTALLDALTDDISPFLRRFFRREPLPSERINSAVPRHRQKIGTLSQEQIRSKLNESRGTLRTLRDWEARLREVRFAPALTESINDVCDRIRTKGIKMSVVHVPESPYLETLYPQWVWARYVAELRRFEACADIVVANKSSEFGLTNRHYVNRLLDDGFDYRQWSEPDPLTDDRAFDADHMNPLGANLFTRGVTPLLKHMGSWYSAADGIAQ